MSRRASKKKSSRKTGFFKWLRRQFGLSARPVLDARRLWFQNLETRRLLVAPIATYYDGVMAAPFALAFDTSGNLYVANEGNNTVEKFAPGSTTPSATYDTGEGSQPGALAFDSNGNLYVGDEGSNVLEFAPNTTTPSATYPGSLGFNEPFALAIDSSNNLYVANYGGGSGNTVFKFASGSTAVSATYSGLAGPAFLILDSSNNLYVANGSGTTVEKFAAGSTSLAATYSDGVNEPYGLAFDSSHNLYVANFGNSTVEKFAQGSTTPSIMYTVGVDQPDAVAVDSAGNLYVSNLGNSSVEEFASGSTTPSVTYTSGVSGPEYLALDSDGNLYVANGTGTTVEEFASAIPAAAASKLQVSASPSSLSAGSATSLTITAEDSSNQVVTGFSDSVTLSDSLGDASFSAVSFTNGVATVTATLDKAGTQTITANDASATIVGTSNPISVAPGAATQLLITTQPPSTVTAGMEFGFTVTAEDAEDNVATGFNGSETVALHDSPFGGTLSGTLTSSAAGGIATFAGLTLNKASTDYRLAVTSGTLTSAPSSWITVVPGTATQLLITSQPPSTVTAYSEFNFTVTAEDADGNADTNFDGSETVALASGPMGGTLAGTPTVSATAGVATFSGQVLNTVGDYTLDVTSGTLTLATSNSISVTPVPASGSEFQVNTYTPGNQQIAKVAMDAAGDYVIAWQSYYYNVGYGAGYNVYGQRYNASGAEVGSQFQVNTYTGRDSTTPSVAMDSAGDFVVAWVGYDGAAGDYGVYAQQYTASGATNGSNFLVNTYTAQSNQLTPSVAMDSAGDFVVAWTTVDEDGSNYGVYAQRYSASGATNGSEFRVNTYTPGDQSAPSAAMDSAGDFVIAWTSYGEDGSGNGVYAQRYNASGATNGSEFRVNTYTTDNQSAASVAMDSAGDFVVAWQSGSFSSPTTEDGSSYGVYAQLYNASGATEGSEFQVNTYTTGLQNAPSVAMDSAGDFVVVWQSPQDGGPTPADAGQFGVYAQAYNASGTAQASEFQVNTYTPGLQGGPAVARDSAGDFVVAWQSQYQDGSLFGIYAKRYEVPSSGASKLVVSASPGTLTAGSTTSVTITAEDASNGVVTSFSDSVTLSDSLGGASFGAVTFSSGKATVTATLDTAGTQTITASDTSVGTVAAGTSGSITVSPSAPPSFDLTISTAATNNVSLSGGVFSATGGNPNINIGDLSTALVNNANVVITNSALTGDSDNIQWLAGANLNSSGIPDGHTLAIETAPSATSGNLSISSSVNLPGDLLLSGQNVMLNGSVNTSGTLWINSAGAVSQSAPLTAASLSVTASGNVGLSSANNVSGTLAIHDAALGAFVEWLDADGFTVGAVAAASAAEDPQGIFGAVSGVSASGNFIALENTSGNMLLGDGGASEGVTATGTGGDVRLESAGQVTQNANGGGAITAGALGIVAGGNVELSQVPNTAVLVSINNTSGYVRFVDSSGFTVGTVGPVSPAIFPNAVHGVTTVGGDIGLQTNDGDLSLGNGNADEVVSATGTGGDVRLDSAGALQTPGSGAITAAAFAVVANGNVDLSESANTVFLVAISDSSGYVRLVDSESFIVGTVGGVSAKLDPNAIHGVSTVGADIGLETTNGSMILGNGNADEVISATGVGGDVRLDSAGYIMQNTSAGGTITAGALGIVAHGNVDLSESPNSVLVLAAQDSSGYVRFVNNQSLAVGSVGPAGTIFTSAIHGVTTVDGDIALQTNAGSLQLGNGSSSEIVSATGAGGDVRLESAGNLYQDASGGGAITAAAFGVVAAGPITLNVAANDVTAILAIDDTAAGAVNFSDSASFVEGTVGAVSPKIFPHAISGVTTVTPNPML